MGAGKGCEVPSAAQVVIPGLLLFFLSAVVWILRITSRLSRAIHDDHSSYWVNMEQSHLSDWYNPYDSCVLSSPAIEHVENLRHHNYKNISSRFGDFHAQDINWTHNCGKQHLSTSAHDKRQKRPSVPSFCKISNCDHSTLYRDFHHKDLNSKLFGLAPRSTFVQHLYELAKAEHTLVFIGDSITKQNVEAMFCEVTKLDDSVKLIGNLSSVEHVRIVWNNKTSQAKAVSLPLSVYYIPFNGIKVSEDLIHLNNHSRHHVHHRTSLSDLKIKVDHIQASFSGGMTLVMSVGSSYYSRMKFRDDIGSILDWLNVIGDNTDNGKQRVFFRENAAQHWNTTSYGYQTLEKFAEGTHLSLSCVPLVDTQNTLDWRNREVFSYIHNANLVNINIIPFRDITTPLFNMHSKIIGANKSLSDCTNFCFLPQMWQVVWSRLVESAHIVY